MLDRNTKTKTSDTTQPAHKIIRIDGELSLEYAKGRVNEFTTAVDETTEKLKHILALLDLRDTVTMDVAKILLERIAFLQSTRHFLTGFSLSKQDQDQ